MAPVKNSNRKKNKLQPALESLAKTNAIIGDINNMTVKVNNSFKVKTYNLQKIIESNVQYA